MRLFVACRIDEPIRRRLGETVGRWKASVRGVKWVDPGSIHLTLKFLGEVQHEPAQGIIPALDGPMRSAAPLAVRVRGVGCFPSERRPKVVWAGLEGEIGALSSLRDAVETVLEPVGFEREGRAFSPHLTLGRTKRNATAAGLGGFLEENKETEFGAQVVSEVVLMKSVLTPAGAVYTPVHEWGLGENR